jgi:hypothetical protein
VKKDFLENVRGPGSGNSVPSVSRFTSTVRSSRSVALFIRTSNSHFTTQNGPSGFSRDGKVFFWPQEFTIQFNIHDLVSRSFNHFGFRVSLSFEFRNRIRVWSSLEDLGEKEKKKFLKNEVCQ